MVAASAPFSLGARRPTLAFPGKYPAGVLPPWAWGMEKLGLEYYDWQARTLESIGQRIPTALCAANESGKTTYVIATAVLWFLDTFGDAGGKVVVTSGSWMQLRTQLAPAIRQFSHLFPSWEFLDTEAKRLGCKDPQLIMFSTDNAGRAEGHHALDPETAPLMFVLDESKSIPDFIFQAVDRCGPQFLLLSSSPGPDSGQFYRALHEESALYYGVRVTSMMCPHIKEEKRERDRIKYGENHPVYRSMHLAEFTEAEGLYVLAKGALRKCQDEPPAYIPGPMVAFCDFAAGGDENTLAIRDGNRVWLEAAWREADTIQAVRRFISLLEARGLTPSQVFADESGLGHVMCDAFKDEGWPINRVNNGAPPLALGRKEGERDVYANRGAEIWFQAARKIERQEIILEGLDPTSFAQMTSRKAIFKEGSKLALEAKEDMAARGLSSPDRADAIFGAIDCGPHIAGAIATTKGIRLGSAAFARPRIRF